MKNEYDAHKALVKEAAKKSEFTSQYERMSFSERLALSLELNTPSVTYFATTSHK